MTLSQQSIASQKSKPKKETEEEIAARYARIGINRPPRLDNRLRFKAFIDRINRRQWNMLPDGIHPKLTYNGHPMSLYEYTQHLKQDFPPKSNVTLEIVSAVGGKIRDGQQDTSADGGGGPVGARLRVKTIIIDGAGLHVSTAQRQKFEYSRHMFVYFFNNKISDISDISDEGDKFRQLARITPLPTLRPPPPRVSIDMQQFYEEYIDTINSSKGGHAVQKFCKPTGVTWNGNKKSADEYCMLMGNAFDAIPDLQFTAHTVLVNVEKQQIAARIDFTGTPVKPFGGGIPNGRPVAFTEHAFYWLEQGKISDVLTIVDWESYRAQLMY